MFNLKKKEIQKELVYTLTLKDKDLPLSVNETSDTLTTKYKHFPSSVRE